MTFPIIFYTPYIWVECAKPQSLQRASHYVTLDINAAHSVWVEKMGLVSNIDNLVAESSKLSFPEQFIMIMRLLFTKESLQAERSVQDTDL